MSLSGGVGVRIGIAVAPALWLLSLCAPASAQSLEDARRQYLRAEFEEAVGSFEAVLAQPSLGPEEAVEAHRYLMVLSQMLGDAEAAAGHAEAALALDPSVAAPEGAPPEVAERLDEARARLEGRRARLSIEAPDGIRAGEEARIVSRLDPAPSLLVSQLRLRCASGQAVADERGEPPETELRLQLGGESVRCRASALTAGGATLVEERSTLSVTERAAGPGDGAGPGEEPRDEGGGDDAAIWVGVIVAIVAVGAGAAVGVYFATQPNTDVATLGVPTVVGW